MRKKTIDTIPVLTDEIKNILNTFPEAEPCPPVSQTVPVLP